MTLGIEEMNIKPIYAAFLLTAVACISAWAETNDTVFLDCMVENINTNWIGKTLLDAIGDTEITQVIILQNNTSAFPQMHADGIRHTFTHNPILEINPSPTTSEPEFFDRFSARSFFDCIAVMRNGLFVRVQTGHGYGRITTDGGQAYFRKYNSRTTEIDNEPNKGVQAIGDKSPQPDP